MKALIPVALCVAALTPAATLVAMAPRSEGTMQSQDDPRVYPAPPPITPAEPGGGHLYGLCLPTRTVAGAKIIALGAYEGSQSTDLVIGGTPHETGVIAVTGSASGPPVVLILSAYEATIWDLRRFPHRRLRAILAYGYYDQAVAGVPGAIPVRFQSRGQTGACGRATYAYKGGRELERLAAAVMEATGRRIDDFQGGYGPSSFDIDRRAAGAPVTALDSGELRSAVAIRRDRVRPGAAGIAQLIAEGTIRPAAKTDLERLSAALTRTSPTGYLAPVHPEHLGPRTYVVLRPTLIPRGMYGGRSATFLLSPGIAWPTDPGSHNTYYSLADGKCRGPGCER
ncbi:MAG: hypothetical protein MT490_13700 [Sphingomonas sp.]|uniref:hypothetical protein n=1 Tax=Sphingomonas sp. TaxID=28214 RepID=UPI002276BC66|nr:hypothetical protein [Sphingomonas sp.]MCX8476841.1 hypothetical protein [Sphingomonas sp.]